MGFDWEELLGAEGEDLMRAYEDSIPDYDAYSYRQEYDPYDDYWMAEEETEEMVDELVPLPYVSMDPGPKRDLAKRRLINPNYIRKTLKGEQYKCHLEQEMWTDADGEQWPKAGKLFHATDVIHALDHIRRQILYSHEKAVEFGLPPLLDSSEREIQLGIYNDIFLDNVDIPSITKLPNVWGPVTFVLDHDVLLSQTKTWSSRITKIDPWKIPTEKFHDLECEDIFFTEESELRDAIKKEGRGAFLKNSEHHTAVFDKGKLWIGRDLHAIYVDRCPDGSGKEKQVKALLEAELQKARMGHVPVVIRTDVLQTTAPCDELWRIPE